MGEKSNISFLYKICSALSFVFVIVYFLDILWLGNGVVGRIGPLSIRILWFVLAGVFSVPMLIKNVQLLLRNKYIWLVCVFLVWMAISAVCGIINNNSLAIIKSDVFGFMNLCLLPTLLCVLSTPKRRRILSAVIVMSCLAIAGISVCLSYFTHFSQEQQEAIYNFTQRTRLCVLVPMNGGTSRVLFHTAGRYFLVAYIILLYCACKTKSRFRAIAYLACMGLMILAIVISYARAFYGGCGIAVIALLIFVAVRRDIYRRRAIVAVLLSGAIGVAMIVGLGVTQNTNIIRVAAERVLLLVNYEFPEVTEPTESTESTMAIEPTQSYLTNMDSELASLDDRQQKLDQLAKSIAKNPVFGNGLGAAVQVDNGYVEYSYHDFLNKMGIVGLLLYVAPFLLQLWEVAISKRRGKYTIDSVCAVVVMVYFWFIAYFNPCMNTTVGIACYLLTIVVFHYDISKISPSSGPHDDFLEKG